MDQAVNLDAGTRFAAIEHTAEEYAKRYHELARFSGKVRADLAKVIDRWLPEIRQAVADRMAWYAELHELIAASPDLFTKPRTQSVHGFRVGLRAEPGTLAWPDDDQLIANIEELFPDLSPTLIKTEKKVLKKGLEQLTDEQLEALGVWREGDGDAVVIKPLDTAAEKLVDALVKAAVADLGLG